MSELTNRDGGNSESLGVKYRTVDDIVKTLNQVTLEDNISLQTFRNTAKSTFGLDSGISIWVDNTDILRSDLRDFDEIVISVLAEKPFEGLKDKTIEFREILSIDFSADIKLTNKALRRPMMEVWTSTPDCDIWLDKSILPQCDEETTFYIPYDYYLLKKPIIFSDKRFVKRPEILVINTSLDSGYIPYFEHKYIPDNN